MRKSLLVSLIVALVVASGLGYWAGSRQLLVPGTTLAAAECATFAETGKQVCGRFLEYWRANGGLTQQGLPLSDEFDEANPTNGKVYKTQYFERARFELHPENVAPYDVLLGLVGREQYQAKYPGGLPGGEAPLKVGQALIMPGGKAGGTFRVTITGVQRRSTISDTRAKGIFVVVYMDATNLGQQPDYLSSFSLRDQKGRTFTYSLDGVIAAIYANDVPGEDRDEDVQPSLTEQLHEVFDVAPDATDFTIVPRK